jgi:hypothetical protein
VVVALQLDVYELSRCGFAEQIRAPMPHHRQFDVMPPLHRKTRQLGQHTSGPPSQNALQSNVVFVHRPNGKWDDAK